ncbi:MAG TPA: RNA polymerase sigma factor [Polyangiaceae bacterium]|nr:RNA polymerase sigma factor [Polyangiaceae bacterium]
MSNLEGVVERFLKGDAAAFQELVNATSTRLVRLSARMLGNVADAEDVVQEAYVKAYRSLLDGQFDRRAKIETWLYRIVVNATIDARRKRTRRGPAVVIDEETAIPAQEGQPAGEARRALTELADWLDDLPPDQQAVLVLKAVEGRESAEIAEILGCSEGAVEQRLVRARATLRQRRNDS